MLRKLHSRQHYLVSLPVLVSLPRFSATWFWEYERCVGENREGARNGRLTCAAGKAVRRVSAILCAFICALVISLPASADSDLPNCPSDTQVTWTDCQGTYTFDNGNTYAGEWRDDKPHGQGTNTYVNGDKYVGEYSGGIRNGQGTLTFTDGSEYIGKFRDGDYNGQGTYTYADGSEYVGEFKDDLYHGQGTYTYVNGDEYVGEFRDDKRNGQGILTHADGRVWDGLFRDGEWVSGKQYTAEQAPSEVSASRGEDAPPIEKILELVDEISSRIPMVDWSEQDVSSVLTKLENLISELGHTTKSSKGKNQQAITTGDEDYNLICVSRDDDGLSPYSIALRNGPIVEEKRFLISYTDNDECKSAIGVQEAEEGNTYICASRDNDGLRPHEIVIVDFSSFHNRYIKTNVVPGTKENCHRALDAKMHSQGSDYMCASKDRDGLRPFGLVRVERTGDSPLVGGVFGSFEECLASL